MADISALLPTLTDVRNAALRIAGKAVRTPLISSALLDEATGGRILLKPECLQRTGSFKFRGAYNALVTLDPAARRRGVVTVSSGNHAQGLAEAARLLGIPATIVMPVDAPAMKLSRTERSGASIVLYDRETGDRDALARVIMEREGKTFIHPYDNRQVIAGQGTIGLEILDDADIAELRLDAVLVPCGGGGLAAGVGLVVRRSQPGTMVHTVEPVGFDDYARSLRLGKPVANERRSGSVCDALMAPSPGPIGFAMNRVNLTGGLSVTDEEALAAVAFAYRELKLVLEPGGAVALAAVLSGRIDCRGRNIAVVLSGGNIDDAMMRRALAVPVDAGAPQLGLTRNTV